MMKRHLSRWRWMIPFAACVGVFINCSAAQRESGRYVEHSGAVSASPIKMSPFLQHVRLADTSSAQAAAYFGDVPTTVVGVYGATTLDMLSSGPLVLVKWPDGCCSPSQRWHTRRSSENSPASPKEERAHTFFLWPAL
jgi:hypothetical protein